MGIDFKDYPPFVTLLNARAVGKASLQKVLNHALASYPSTQTRTVCWESAGFEPPKYSCDSPVHWS